jgi:3-hydroxyacyl-[acyl-carrier-protein] dehydratase
MTAAAPEAITLTFDQVREMLPQRFPLIMVDRVLSCRRGLSIECLKNISGNDFLLTGHFPDMAIFPGALLLEGVAQSAILLHRLSFPAEPNCVHLFGSVKARFVSPVYPGDQVIYNVEFVTANRVATTFRGEGSVDRRIVTRCELAMSTRPAGPGPRPRLP